MLMVVIPPISWGVGVEPSAHTGEVLSEHLKYINLVRGDRIVNFILT